MSALEPWLKKHLEATGAIDHRGIGRRAQVRHCGGCGLVILVGLDGDSCALVVEADPAPLTPLGEALALIEGRRTVTLNFEGRWVLNTRYDLQIEHHPAGTQAGEDVLRSHLCGSPHPVAPIAGPSRLPTAVRPLPPNSPPPF